ncbi:MAG TPA: alpha/beta hydrolase [Polyangiaceae bacterium]
MPRRHQVLVALSITGALLALLAFGFRWFMQQPLYQPGMARALVQLGTPVATATVADSEAWQVEPGISLAHFEVGTGRPVLVVHGGPGIPFRQPMAGLLPLTERYRFYYYDQRGCGRSTRPFERFVDGSFRKNFRTLESKLGLGAQIADIERIRQALAEEKLVLIGHSFGALIASLYAAEFPDHVAALIPIAPANLLVMPPPGGGLFADMDQLLPAPSRDEYRAYIAEYLDFQKLFKRTESEASQLNAQLGRFFVEAARKRGFAVPIASAAETESWGGFMVQAMYLSMGRRHDYRPAVRVVTAPVLVLHGANDLQSESVSRSFAQAFPNAHFEVTPNAGHLPFADAPKLFAELVGKVLG